MRIACYGLVDQHAGSVSSANYHIVEELLARGHTVDFYAKADYVRPEEFFDHPGFTYHGVLLEGKIALRQRIPAFLDRLTHRFSEAWLYRQHLDAIAKQISDAHRRQRFDVLLFLGVGALFEVEGLTTVSWLQGPPQTEWKAIKRLGAQIRQLSGTALFWKLKLFYAYKQRVARRELNRSDHVICGSEWSRQHIIAFGMPADRVHALPYPFDMDLFAPQSEQPLNPGKRTFLWLGRIDPRKRLDLMLEAFKLLIEERGDVHLELIGRLNYAPEYKQLVDAFPYPEHITYRDFIARPDVPRLLNQVDVAVQPSEDENFGSTVAEALCCGKPVVLGPSNGTGEFCGEAAFLFEAYTAESVKEALARALEALEVSPESVRRSARDAAESAFQTARVVAELEQICAAAAGMRRGPRTLSSTSSVSVSPHA